MDVLRDFEGNRIRLSKEIAEHIRRRHPRVFRIPRAIELTLSSPDFDEPSLRDPESRVYGKVFSTETMEDWLVRVIVVFKGNDAFIVTATVNRIAGTDNG